MDTPQLSFNLTLSDAGADGQLLEELTGYMLVELRELGVDGVERVEAAPPPGAAKGDGFTLGALALATVPALLPSLVTYLREWSMRGRDRAVSIETPTGLKVTFTPDNQLSQAELLSLVEQLSAGGGRLGAPDPDEGARLRHFLVTHYSASELKDLAFDLNVNYDELPGEGTANKSRELVSYLRRRGRVQALVEAATARRPDIPW